MSLRIGILVFPKVQQLDLTGPFEVFSLVPGAEVLLVAAGPAPVTSATGLVLMPTATYAACPALDVVCVPGGVGVNALLRDETTLTFLRQQAEQARFVTSVCTGALVLGAAGLLRGRRATTHWAALDLLAAFGAGTPETAPPEALTRTRRRLAQSQREREAIVADLTGAAVTRMEWS